MPPRRRPVPPPTVASDSDALFALAILKGYVEHGEGHSYFASFGGYQSYLRLTLRHGWLEENPAASLEGAPAHLVTDRGHQVYAQLRLSDFPQKPLSRAYTWRWDSTPLPEGWNP